MDDLEELFTDLDADATSKRTGRTYAARQHQQRMFDKARRRSQMRGPQKGKAKHRADAGLKRFD